eukprot:CAMPEP_0174832902 /NCGR_PEP_ID=MMETSP1114-20130205/3916_1 /TAXON_ID=312471 /ORGANISM="Neobodo designis, Strain CCAP 1951/1" /LENGTH=367 /DNA_ID=CAMNT_0016066769 /DNA_START=29 /DNA_END=1129 /DNA_ORIENTATION=+
MSIVRLGPWLCETDETHTFSPQAIFGEGNAALTLVAPTETREDLAEVTFTSDVDCIRVEGAPVVDHEGGRFYTGAIGDAPQFVVAPRHQYAALPACVRTEVSKFSSRHFFVGCADLTDTPFIKEEDQASQGISQRSEHVGGARSDVLRPATVRAAYANAATRSGRLFRCISEQALRLQEASGLPYLGERKRRTKGQPRAYDFASEWSARAAEHHGDDAHTLSGAERTFFAAYERAVKCAYGFEERFPDADEVAATEGCVTVAAVAADDDDIAKDPVLRRRRAHFAMFVEGTPARRVVRQRRAEKARREVHERGAAKRAGELVNGGFRAFMKAAHLSAKDAGKAWRCLSAEDKSAWKEFAITEMQMQD